MKNLFGGTMNHIFNNYESQPGNSNYALRVDFDPETQEVEIYNFFGNGQTMQSFNGLTCRLGSDNCEHANVDALVDLLEGSKAQALLDEIREGFSSHFDGSNHVGSLTEDAASALESLRYLVEDVWQDLPGVWSASEWYLGASIYRESALKLVEAHGSLEEAVSAETSYPLPTVVEGVEEYLTSELQELADDDDNSDLRNRARKLLGMPELATLREIWAHFDEDQYAGVKFEDFDIAPDDRNIPLITLVDDGSFCWLAVESEIESALDTVIEVPSGWKTLDTDDRDELEDNSPCQKWYSVLCRKVRHESGLVDKFEALFGTRNWV